MGMYTELYIGTRLNKDTPEELVKWLSAHTDDNCSLDDVISLAPSELRNTRYKVIGGCSAYFEAEQHFQFGYDTGHYYLTFGNNIKNYSDEINTLLGILEPHIHFEGHIGHYRYEEEDLPTVLYYDGKKIQRIKCNKEK